MSLRAETLSHYSLAKITMTKKKYNESSVEKDEAIQFNEADFFYTFDMGLSAALIGVGFSLVSLDRENLRKVQFVFRRADGMDETVDAYWADTLQLKARAYFDTIKMLKNRLHSE